MSNPPPPPHVVEDCRGIVKVLSDGSVVRSPNHPLLFSPAVPDDYLQSVQWKDLRFDPANDLHLRLYKPLNAAATATKLPVFFYFHGGGFCIGSRTWPVFHACCLRLARDLRAIVVAPDYRLAPESRLPAALDDAVSAVEWVRAQENSPDADPLFSAADFGNVFVSGESAGGNLAHHLAIRFNLAAIRGLVLLMPGFGGTERTESESECPLDVFLTLDMFDRYWRLALPNGASRDHPLSNPFGPGSPRLEEVAIAPMLVVIGGRDMLRDRNVDYVERMKAMGKPVEMVVMEGQQHAFFPADPWSAAADELVRVVEEFVDRNRSVE